MMKTPSALRAAQDALAFDSHDLKRSLHFTPYEVPSKVELKNGTMHFSWGPGQHESEKTKKDLWREFIALSRTVGDRGEIKDPRPIVKFAKRWGPLFEAGHLSEALCVWAEAIRVAGAVLRVSAELERAEWGSDVDWQILCEWLRLPQAGIALGGRVPAHSSAVLRRTLVGAVINQWFKRASRPPRLIDVSKEGGLIIEHVSGGLAGALAIQFAQLIARRDNTPTCSFCNRQLPRDHKARNGIRRYCAKPKCQRAARADASRDYRSRRKLIGSAAHRA
jgi:hypothetical protein